MKECWKILGLDPVRDVSAIRHAYAEKARTCHPEEDAEGFLALRKAYETAMEYAKQEGAPSLISAGKEEGIGTASGNPERQDKEEIQSRKDRWSERNTERLPAVPKKFPEESERTVSEKLPMDWDWTVSEELPGEDNPFRDCEAIKRFLSLYTGKQRRDMKLWKDYFTSGSFLDAAWDSRFMALLWETAQETKQDFPPNKEFQMWLAIAYPLSLTKGEALGGMEYIRRIAAMGPPPKRPGGDELAMRESFQDYRHLVELADSGIWNEQAMEEFKWIAGRYTFSYIKERCDPKGNPDHQRHPAGLGVFTHFFQRSNLPEELYRIVWQKYGLKSAVTGRAGIFYGPLRKLAIERIPGIEREEPENFFRLNQDRAACFARIQKNPGLAQEELTAFFAREDVRKALRSRRFVEEQLLSWSDWLNIMTPQWAVRWLAEYYQENQDIPGWSRVVRQAEEVLESHMRKQEREQEAQTAVPEEPDLSLLLRLPNRVYARPLTGHELVFGVKENSSALPGGEREEKGDTDCNHLGTEEWDSEESRIWEALKNEMWESREADKEKEELEPLTEERLLALFDCFAKGQLARLELDFNQAILALVRDGDQYGCFCFETGYDTWYSMLSQPEIYETVESKEEDYRPFGMGKLAFYNIHETAMSVLSRLNLVFMQIGRGRIQVKIGERWLWSSHTSRQNSRFKKHMAMQKFAGFPAGRLGVRLAAKFVFGRYPCRMEWVSLSGERTLTKIPVGDGGLAADALAWFFQKKLARLRLTWEEKESKDKADGRHVVLLQEEGQYMMAWMEDGREEAYFYASDVPCVFGGRVYPACVVHPNPDRIRNCLDLMLDDMDSARLVTGRPGEFVPADRPYALVRAELIRET